MNPSASDARLAAMRGMVDAIAEKLGEQMKSARTELARADHLLGDAIEQFITAFDKAVGPAHPPGSPTIDVDAAVTALQFRDLVGQKLGHVRDQLVAAEEVMYEIRLALAEDVAVAATTLAPPDVLEDRMHQLLQTLERIDATTPVSQQRIQGGEVELF